jgi:hypothetical protein
MPNLPTRPIVAAIVSGVGTAFLTAVVLAIIDLYLTGHSKPALGRPWISLFGGSFALSRAELLFYLAIIVGAWAGWRQATVNP